MTQALWSVVSAISNAMGIVLARKYVIAMASNGIVEAMVMWEVPPKPL